MLKEIEKYLNKQLVDVPEGNLGQAKTEIAFRTANARKVLGTRKERSAGAVKFFNETVEVLAAAIEKDVHELVSGRCNRAIGAIHLYHKVEGEWQTIIPAKIIAYIAMRLIVSNEVDKMAVLASKIGDAITTEYAITHNLSLYSTLTAHDKIDRIKKKRGVKRQMTINDTIKYGDEHARRREMVERTRWEHKINAQIGLRVLELAIISGIGVEIIELAGITGKNTKCIQLDKQANAYIQNQNAIRALGASAYPAMVVPPRDWTDNCSGGFITNMKLSLVKSRNPAEQDYTKPWLRAVNAVQQVPFMVNESVLQVADWLIKHEFVVAGLADRKIKDIPTGKESWAAKLRADAYNHNTDTGRIAKILNEDAVIEESKRLKGGAFYNVAHLDFRGRLYYAATKLNIQSNDLHRGLMRFAKAKEHTGNSKDWLKIIASGYYGNDKKPFPERLAWVNDNLQRIRKVAHDPLSDESLDFWANENVDKPFQFLACCFEIGLDLPFTNQICFVDGACNGLQHYAALTRDETLAALVSLVPAEKPADVYAHIADLCAKTTAYDWSDMAKFMRTRWTRDLVKLPVMTTPYSITYYGIRNQILNEDELMDEARTAGLKPGALATYIAKVIAGQVKTILPHANKAKQALKDLTKSYVEELRTFNWQVEDGFNVDMLYVKDESVRIQTVINGSLSRRRTSVDINLPAASTDRAKMALAVAPNVIHSLDSLHLRKTVIALLDAGVQDFAFIHDSYATHATDLDTLNTCLREAFVAIYEKDVLGGISKKVEQDTGSPYALPPLGTLDVREVLRSKYIFR